MESRQLGLQGTLRPSVPPLRVRVYCKFEVSGFGGLGLADRATVTGFRVWGFGLSVKQLGLRVEGLRAAGFRLGSRGFGFQGAVQDLVLAICG